MHKPTDEETIENLKFIWFCIKMNWYLIPFAIIMTWGIIATLTGS